MEADPSVEVHMVVAATVVVHSAEAHTEAEVMAEAATVVVADTSEDVAKAQGYNCNSRTSAFAIR